MIDVTCAIIRNEENDILIVQRGENTDHPFKWEFPGGKIMHGESDEDCILREIKEELSMNVVICRKLKAVEHDYGIKKIKLIPFVCDTLDDIPFLTEHIAYRWIHINDLAKTDFSEADIYVAREYMITEGVITDYKNSNIDNDIADEGEVKELISRIVGTKGADWVAGAVCENELLLGKLIYFSFQDDQKLAFHSSWILSKAHEKTPDIFTPYLSRIIQNLNKLLNESAMRSFLKILSVTDLSGISVKDHGILADLCFKLLKSTTSAIALKAYSMEILYRLTLIYPELTTELVFAVRPVCDNDSAGVASKARSVLKKLTKS